MKIALIGSAPSSVALGPYKDASYDKYLGGKPPPQYPPSPVIGQEWEIWACSPGAYGVIPRCTRFFELHRWEPGQPWFSPEYVQFLKEFRNQVYTGGVVEELPNHVVYPLQRVEEEFSSYFLTSSLSLMMALAILEIQDLRKADPAHDPNDDVIGFWGVDMAANEEWSYQRPGCQFFVLEALRRGIGVFIPPESDVMRPMPVYGICEWDASYIKATVKMKEINLRTGNNQQALNQAQTDSAFVAGAKDMLNYYINTWISPFGFPTGMIMRQSPGTGLGGNVTHVDGNPVAPPVGGTVEGFSPPTNLPWEMPVRPLIMASTDMLNQPSPLLKKKKATKK